MADNGLIRVDTITLPKPKVLVICCGLALTLLISFIDQNSLGVALPAIGEDLNCTTTVAWAGTSSLIGSTVSQVLYGRLSDIFGRKSIYLAAVAFLVVGELLCSFAKTGPQLYAFRGISGVGTSGITASAMIIVSDLVNLEERGKYQGILGACIGVGNAIGPFLAASVVEKLTWRALFWILSPLVVPCGCWVAFTLPPNTPQGNMKTKVKAIDYFGILFSSSAVVLLLIPVSDGGTTFAWSSPMVITMLCLGCTCMILFILAEWKWARMPMMPLHLFRIPAVAAVLMQSALGGIVYFSHVYYLPIYYQVVRGFSPIHSATLILPFVSAHAIFSVLSGQYVSRTKRYGELVYCGFALWTLGCGLLLLLNRHTPEWEIVVFLVLEGTGVGLVLQPSLVAAQAHSSKADRAVVISLRNYLRSLGGAVGLALSAAIFCNVLREALNSASPPLNRTVIAEIISAIHINPDRMSLSALEQEMVLDAYMAGARSMFIFWAPVMGACLLLCILIRDRGLGRPEEERKAQENSGAATPASVETDVEMQSERISSRMEKD